MRRGRCAPLGDAASSGGGSRATSQDGLPGWENLLGTLGPERIEIANAAPPNEDAVGRTLAGDRRRARQRCGRGGARPDAGVGPRRDDGAPLRLRRRRPRDRRPPAPARRLGRHLRRAAASPALRAPRRASSGGSRSGTGCSRSRRRWRGSRPGRPTGSAFATAGRIAPGKRADLVLLDPAALRRHGDVRGSAAVARGRRGRLGGRHRASGGTARRPARARAASSAELPRLRPAVRR